MYRLGRVFGEGEEGMTPICGDVRGVEAARWVLDWTGNNKTEADPYGMTTRTKNGLYIIS